MSTNQSPWRSLGSSGDSLPDWLRELKGKSGVYAIREPGIIRTHVVVYVGESHTGRLAKTIARHFQAWNRGKGWFAGVFRPLDSDPGRTYNRSECEVCVRTCPANDATSKRLQAAWIERLKPRDNVFDVPEPPDEPDDEIPF